VALPGALSHPSPKSVTPKNHSPRFLSGLPVLSLKRLDDTH
jgi:hypothetical protein